MTCYYLNVQFQGRRVNLGVIPYCQSQILYDTQSQRHRRQTPVVGRSTGISSTVLSVLRQVHSLSQSELSTQGDLVLPLSVGLQSNYMYLLEF